MKREARWTATAVHYVTLITVLCFAQAGFSQSSDVIEDPALENLVENLSSRDPVTRSYAVYNIGEKGAAAAPAAKKLAAILKDDVTIERSFTHGIFIGAKEVVTIGELTVEALWKIGPAAHDYLLNALTDKKEATRLNAIRGIKLIRHRMAGSPFMDNPAYIQALLNLLKDKKYKIRAAAVNLVGILPDDRLLDSLVPALYDKEQVVRREAALIFRWRKGGTKVTDGLVHLCSRDQWESPYIALGRTGDPRVIPALLAGLENRRAYCSKNSYDFGSDQIVDAIIYAMSLIKDQRSVQTLTPMFSSGSAQMRSRVIDALDRLGDPGSFDLYVRAAHDTSMLVRRAAICALCRLGGRRALPVFQDAIKDTHSAIRLVAAWALQELDDHSADSLVRPIIRSLFQPMADTVLAKFLPPDTLTIDEFILSAISLYKQVLFNAQHAIVIDDDFWDPYSKLRDVICWIEPREVLNELVTIVGTFPGEYSSISPAIARIMKMPLPVDFEDLPFFIQYTELR